MEFIMFCFVLSIIFGLISGFSKTSGSYSSTRDQCASENNYYVLFLDWNKSK